MPANCCLLCESQLGDAIQPGAELGAVTSDMKPWPRFGEIVVCTSCGHVQKELNRAWEEQVAQIYAEYELNLLSGGVEQVVFTNAGALTRSERVLAEVQGLGLLPSQGRMLDIGCGNGATLRAFGGRLPRWRLCGFEVNERTREEVLALAGVEAFVTGDLEAVPGMFDCMTLFHVLEHLPEPTTVLRWVRHRLTPEGILVVQIPDVAANPFDLAVFDHSSHFDVQRLSALATATGFETVDIGGAVPKELTGVFRNGSGKESPLDPPGDAVEVAARVRADLNWLAGTRAAALARAQRGPLGIFGTAVAGTWLAGSLGERVSFFVDEDPERIGKIHLGRPVFAPGDVPSGSSVLIAFTPLLAREICDRIAAQAANWTVVSPPEHSVIAIGATTDAGQA